MSLKRICRTWIRGYLGTKNLQLKIFHLNLASSMIKYLRLERIHRLPNNGYDNLQIDYITVDTIICAKVYRFVCEFIPIKTLQQEKNMSNR